MTVIFTGKMNLTKPAKYISYFFIPPVMNLFIFIFISLKTEVGQNRFYGISISFLFGLLFPLIAIFYFRKKGIISNNDATIKEERTLPYIYAIFFSLAGVISSSLIGLNNTIIMLWMVYLINSILIININHFWKVSAHAMGAAMPLGALTYLQEPILMFISCFLLIIICLSRVYLKVHTLLQVMAGSLIGFMVAFVLLKYCL